MASRHYPIVAHRELWPRFRPNALRQRRHPLVAGRHEILVYQLGEEYLPGPLDPARAGRAVAATVVDVRRDVSIYTSDRVRSAEAGWEFPITVIFHCTVVDPVEVVRARHRRGLSDLRQSLRTALRPGRLDGRHRPGDLAGLRAALVARLEPQRPVPATPGVRVVVGEVEVRPCVAVDTVSPEA
ncbi:hypothetical protein [Plantactinospora sp. BB1]|uniref:hypothetical protein n=1 Tax=Plantactinospora sp. BB1 TaxID=2071627 RepID=UPI000D16D33B|nr:hypothetical protein [Plantactinospora sp. BB1]AVT38272.1 hypothetical protein C6W10_19555 [Plantactinospora sp. BB1]